MLQVSSVPHVFAVKGGQILNEFQGVSTFDHIKEFLDKAAASDEFNTTE